VTNSPADGKGGAADVSFYDDLWKNEWRDMEVFNPTARHLQRLINRELAGIGGFGSLLDVGCGIGLNILSIRRKFASAKLSGTDLSPTILDMARRYVGPDPTISFAVLDIANEVLPAQFDVVLCNQVLEHVADDRAAIANLAAMCGRHLLITVPGGRFNSTSRLVGHHRHYSRANLVELVSETGFDILETREWGFPFHSIYKMALGMLPESVQRRVGFGDYGAGKRLLTSLIYLLYFGNVSNRGENIILLARRPEAS
jgi:SAM-dependent methyltransferase